MATKCFSLIEYIILTFLYSLDFMDIINTRLPDVYLMKPAVFTDARGFFLESYNQQTFRDKLGAEFHFFQDNHSRSYKNVLRGLHYQIRFPQGKLVRVTKGEIFDVAVDMRKDSPSFGKWVGMHLSADNHLMAWIPPGFAHGFVVLSEEADVLYKATAPYHKESDRSLLWNDFDIGIQWPIACDPILSEKDALAKTFKDAEYFQ